MAGLTPLFLSIHRGNDILLKEIMTNGGNIEDVNYIGRTPLMQAIVCCCMKEDPEVRICYKGIISNMIECFNAKVGNLGDADVMETPLICIIKELPTPLPTDWKHRIQDIKEIIDLLLKHGADINEVSNAGFTMLHVLCDIICKTQQTGSLLDLFGSLIEYGANLSIPSHRGQSVLGMCIIKYNRQPTKFYNFLQKLGASLVRQEIDAVFVEWAQCPGFRKSFDMIQYKNHITQPAIDSAYETAFFKDGKLFHLLKEHFPKTTIAEKVASEALLTLENYSKQFGFALEFDSFNGLYIHSNGNSLLHSIVDRLEKYPKYKDAHARDDAYNVLCKGAPLEHKDTQGKTPLQKLFLSSKGKRLPNFEALFIRRESRLGGSWGGAHARQGPRDLVEKAEEGS
ncbi:hypothetical protein TrVGV298_004031 [Trichoderma virens]|nr:hypothetical protein TrVGV298_004031 [Trichoderma virens]